jgi:hypothetical protein
MTRDFFSFFPVGIPVLLHVGIGDPSPIVAWSPSPSRSSGVCSNVTQ